MFKKSLLALTVATLAASASAGTIYSSVTDATTPVAADFNPGNSGAGLAGEPLGVIAGASGAVLSTAGNCNAAATFLKVTLTGSTSDVATAGGDNDSVSAVTVSDKLASSAVAMTGANACTVAIGDVVSTAAAKSPIEAPKGTVNLTASIVPGIGGYEEEDTLTINFTGAKIDTALSTAPKLTLRGNSVDADAQILDITDTTVRFTIQTGRSVAPDDILDLSGIVLDSTGLSSSTDVKIGSFATNTSGTQYDVIAPVSVHALVPQYSVEVKDAFDGIINVSDDRQSLALNSADDFTGEVKDQDTLVLDVDLDATVNQVAAADVTFVLNGNFAWLAEAADTSNNGVAATAAEISTYLNTANIYSTDGGSTFGDATSYALNAEQNQLTIKDTSISSAADVQKDYALRLVVPGKGDNNPILAPQSYTVNVFATDGAAAPNTNVLTAGTNVAAGQWTLNGSVVTIPYMPFGPNTKVIMRHTNTGVQSGDVSVRYMLEGVSTNWENLGVVTTTTRGVKNIRDLVIDAIMADAGVESGKVAIEITSNVPDADVTVYAGFNVKNSADDRGFVGTFGEHGSAK